MTETKRKTSSITFRLPETKHKLLKRYAESKGMSITRIFNTWIDATLQVPHAEFEKYRHELNMMQKTLDNANDVLAEAQEAYEAKKKEYVKIMSQTTAMDGMIKEAKRGSGN